VGFGGRGIWDLEGGHCGKAIDENTVGLLGDFDASQLLVALEEIGEVHIFPQFPVGLSQFRESQASHKFSDDGHLQGLE